MSAKGDAIRNAPTQIALVTKNAKTGTKEWKVFYRAVVVDGKMVASGFSLHYDYPKFSKEKALERFNKKKEEQAVAADGDTQVIDDGKDGQVIDDGNGTSTIQPLNWTWDQNSKTFNLGGQNFQIPSLTTATQAAYANAPTNYLSNLNLKQAQAPTSANLRTAQTPTGIDATQYPGSQTLNGVNPVNRNLDMYNQIYDKGMNGSIQNFNTAAGRLRERLDSMGAGQQDQLNNQMLSRGMGASGLQKQGQYETNRAVGNAYGQGLVGLEQNFEQSRLQGLNTALGAASGLSGETQFGRNLANNISQYIQSLAEQQRTTDNSNAINQTQFGQTLAEQQRGTDNTNAIEVAKQQSANDLVWKTTVADALAQAAAGDTQALLDILSNAQNYSIGKANVGVNLAQVLNGGQ